MNVVFRQSAAFVGLKKGDPTTVERITSVMQLVTAAFSSWFILSTQFRWDSGRGEGMSAMGAQRTCWHMDTGDKRIIDMSALAVSSRLLS